MHASQSKLSKELKNGIIEILADQAVFKLLINYILKCQLLF